MNCPYCNCVLEKGFLRSGLPIQWSVRKRDTFAPSAKKGDITIAPLKMTGPCVAESSICGNCRVIITKY